VLTTHMQGRVVSNLEAFILWLFGVLSLQVLLVRILSAEENRQISSAGHKVSCIATRVSEFLCKPHERAFVSEHCTLISVMNATTGGRHCRVVSGQYRSTSQPLNP
jgi:hypothetical protein